MQLTHLDLFSGIAGFALAAQSCGFRTVGFSEVDDYCCVLLEERFPNIKNYGDIRTADFSELRGRVTVLTGGVPCQPASLAGKRRGSDDDRWLWPATLDVVESIRPTWCIFENPSGILSLDAFPPILLRLANLGYEFDRPVHVPANSVGADHLRYRVFITARLRDVDHRMEGTTSFALEKSTGNGCKSGAAVEPRQSEAIPWSESLFGKPSASPASASVATHPFRERLEIDQPRARCSQRETLEQGGEQVASDANLRRRKERSELQPPWQDGRVDPYSQTNGNGFAFGGFRRVHDGLRARMDDPFARLSSIPPLTTETIPFRQDRLKALGNAVVPAQVIPFFDAIRQIEEVACPVNR